MSSSDRTPPANTGTEPRCAAHPGTITYLRCQQCGTPICPRCLVMTPVGAKCRRCARVRRLPTFDLSPVVLVAAILASVGGGIALGLIGSAASHAIPIVGMLVGMIFPFLAGLALAEVVNRVTNHKRHTALKAIAGAGVVVSYFALALGDFILIGPLALLQSGMLLPLLGSAVISFVVNPINLLFLALGVWIAVQRVG